MPTDPAKDVFDLRVNIDTGGTFTDCYVAGPPGGITAKVDTTPYDLSVGVVESIRLAASKLGKSLETLLGDATSVRLSTTASTNTLLNRSGPKVGLHVSASLEGIISDVAVGAPPP